MANAPKMQNINGSANSYLKATSKKDASSALVNSAIKSAPKEQQQLVQNILAAIRAQFNESDIYQLTLDSRSTDVVLGRIASLLDSYDLSDINDNLESTKNEILNAVNGLSIDSIIKNLLTTGIAELFDNDAKKEDIEDLKIYLSDLFQNQNNDKKRTSNTDQSSELKETDQKSNNINEETKEDNQIQEGNNEETKEDEKVGDYQDTTIAQNFSKLQAVISTQIALLNENLKNIPGQGGIGSNIMKFMKGGFDRISNLTSVVTDKVSKISNSVVGIGKNLAGNAIGGIMKVVKGISGSVAGIGLGVLGAVAAVKGLGAGIKGLGSSIGNFISSPFKKIGGWFKSRKDKKTEKAQAKKESLKQKMMDKMMGLLEKLWDFIEPILSKLKIYMLATIIPIIVVALKVFVILALITAIIVGIVLAVLWIKNKLIPKIKKLFKAAVAKIKEWWGKLKNWVIEKWTAFKEWIAYAWGVIKDLAKAIWDGIIYIISFKWLVDLWKWEWKILCKFGKWIWSKLLEFGEWLYKKFLAPILDPIFDFYYQKIEPAIRPFIESIKNLVGRIKSIWQKFQWDENKSFFENLKCLASIIKDSIVDWWNNSPFKVAYDNHIKPIIDSLSSLIERIKNIWANLHWDENLSFFENLRNAAGALVDGIKEWWNDPDNPIHKAYDTFIKPVVEKIKSAIDTIFGWIKAIYDKTVGLVKEAANKVKGAVTGVDESKLAKNNFNADAFHNSAIKGIENLKKVTDPRELEVWRKRIDVFKSAGKDGGYYATEQGKQDLAEMEKAYDLAQQQVQSAMQPVNSLNTMNQDTNTELQKTGSEMSQKAAEAQAATDDFRQQQSSLGSELMAEMKDFREEQRKANNDPAVIPLPVPCGPQRNAAMMENN